MEYISLSLDLSLFVHVDRIGLLKSACVLRNGRFDADADTDTDTM